MACDWPEAFECVGEPGRAACVGPRGGGDGPLFGPSDSGPLFGPGGAGTGSHGRLRRWLPRLRLSDHVLARRGLL